MEKLLRAKAEPKAWRAMVRVRALRKARRLKPHAK